MFRLALLPLALTLAGCPDDGGGTTPTDDDDGGSSTSGSTTATTQTTLTTAGSSSSSTGSAESGTDTSADTTVGTTMGETETDGTTTDTTGEPTGSSSSGGGSSSTGGLMCEAPEEPCGEVCIDTTTSLENCGMCERACVGEETCVDSLCNGTYELVINGDFAAGTDDWTAGNNPDQVLSCMEIADDEAIVFVDQGGFISNAPGSTGPSSHVFYQDFMVPEGVTVANFTMAFAQNPPEPLDPANVQTIVKDCLDENMDGFNENAFRIDLIDPAEDVYTAPILFEVATPDMVVGDPIAPAFEGVTNDTPELVTFLEGQAGNMLRLRIAHVESTFPWTSAFDDVSLVVDVAY